MDEFLVICIGLISLLILAGILGAASKLDIVSLTVCGHYFILFSALFILCYLHYSILCADYILSLELCLLGCLSSYKMKMIIMI